MAVPVGLLLVAAWAAWRPTATSPETPVVIAAAVAAFLPWAWRRSGPDAIARWSASLAVLACLLLASTLAGWDVPTALEELALAATVLALVWIASRAPAPDGVVLAFALSIALLSLWAVWQVAFGLDAALAAIDDVAGPIRDGVLVRLESGRAFASLPLPGHFAALLAMVVPLLVRRTHPTGQEQRHRTVLRAAGLLLCAVGLALSRSPIGITLAGAAVAAVVIRRRSAALAAGVIVLLALLAVVVVNRGDVTRLDPVRLRLDNWKTACWLWSTSPVAGAGVGSYGQATQAVPFEVGNRPQHAHSLPLEWAAELGLIGIALFGAAAWWLWRLLRELWPRHPELAVALAVVPIHNLVDFSLYVSAVAVPWAVLVGWSLATVRDARAPARELRGRVLAVAAAGLAMAVAALHGTSVVVERAADTDGDRLTRHQLLRTAGNLAPWRLEPVQQQAAVALNQADPGLIEASAHAVTRVRWLRPHSAALASLASQLALARGQVAEAADEAWAARRQRPFDERLSEHLESLLGRLDGHRRR
jgi:hypothetical protein